MTVDLIGTEICSYRIANLLGEGGMASVWRAENAIGKVVAIKTLDPLLARDQDLVERFQTEARIQLQLGQHPNIVAVENFSLEPLAMVMEFVQGRTLAEIIDNEMGAIPVQSAMPWIRQVLSAVEHAHTREVVHRDIKPSNILVDAQGSVRVMDFGIAKVVRDSRLTRTGATLGTAAYMSPEQIKGSQDADTRSDIYSLGVTFYEMLAGRPPFDVEGAGESDFQIKMAHVNEQPPDPRLFYPAIPGPVVVVLMRALAKDPADRYQSVAELRQDLEAAVAGAPLAPAPSPAAVAPARQAPRTVVEQQEQVAPRRAPAPTVVEGGGATYEAIPASRTGLYVGLGGVAVTALVVLVVVLMGSGKEVPVPTPPDEETSTEDEETSTEDEETSSEEEKPVTPPRARHARDSSPMVRVPAGEFTMGSMKRRNEKPPHTVHLDAFSIDKYEVSVARYKACVAAGACDTHHLLGTEWRGARFSQDFTVKDGCNWGKSGREQHPINCVSWAQADSYCRWAGRHLPTEAQWEKAARGSSGRRYPWGNDSPSCDRANHKGCHGGTVQVSGLSSGASPQGALHMAGNVREWVADYYHGRYYSRSPSRNPTGPDSSSLRILRGGCWADKAASIRSSIRRQMYPTDRGPAGGFRCAR